ncbi:MAG: 2-oxoacid:acceptor oxidoreductase family protein [Kiritimatiellia bacterium]
MSRIETRGMYKTFPRSGDEHSKSTHYCAGCGHGIIHKLITEALADLEIQDETIIFNPVGCSVFGYYYWDAGNISAAHGRSPSAATGITRTLKNRTVICYQGDGDLGAIGLNSTIQAANRGEHIAVIFINNATYGMTGGQMAPTTLKGMKTLTSPFGRDPLTDGYPLHVCELINQLKAPVYIDRVSVADTARIMKARKAIYKALKIQKERRGYAFVEIIAPCPTGLKSTPLECARFCIEEMEAEFPLKCFRDNSDSPAGKSVPPARVSIRKFFEKSDYDFEISKAVPDKNFKEIHMRFAGYGGQGVLSLGFWLAGAARIDKRFTTWFPSYGPEQRGGAASCSVIVSGREIGSPAADRPDLFVAMNRVAYERFIDDVPPGGVVLVDETVSLPDKIPEGVRIISVPAVRLAAEYNLPQAANTVMLAAVSAFNVSGLERESIVRSLQSAFRKKPELTRKNLEIFNLAESRLKMRGN